MLWRSRSPLCILLQGEVFFGVVAVEPRYLSLWWYSHSSALACVFVHEELDTHHKISRRHIACCVRLLRVCRGRVVTS